MAGNKRRGRLPAKWMYDLADIDLAASPEVIDYKILSETFKISIRAAQAFCAKLELEPAYVTEGRYAVRKFHLKELKKAAKKYIEEKS